MKQNCRSDHNLPAIDTVHALCRWTVTMMAPSSHVTPVSAAAAVDGL